MESPRIGCFFLLIVFLLLSPIFHQEVYSARPSEKCEYKTENTWTWTDKAGNLKSQGDFQEIIDKHRRWIQTSQREGEPADLSNTKLKGAILGNHDFVRINFTNSDLSYADLRRSNLTSSEFRGANLVCARLDDAVLSDIDFTDMDFSSATVSRAQLGSATLVRAKLKGKDLQGNNFSSANLSEADLTDADLSDADLGGADLRGTNLKGARLVRTSLGEAQLYGANLYGAIFEASTIQMPISIAFAMNIEYLTHTGDSASLARLRSMFKETGFRDQERKITFALKSRQGELLWESCLGNGSICLEYWVNRVLFDLTSQYGMNPGRVLILVLLVFGVATIFYLWMIHSPIDSGLSIIVSADRDRENQPLWLLENLRKQGDEVREGGLTAKKQYKIEAANPWGYHGGNLCRALIRREWALLRVSLMFSLMSTFNIKFRDVDFGRWLRQLTTKEYDIRAMGWARTVSGVQALLSVYLIALLIVTYFGRPFE